MNRRDFASTLGFGALGLLTGRIGTAAVAATDEISDLSFVHPELRQIARQTLKMSAGYELTPDLIQKVRAMQRTSRKPVRPDIPVVEKLIPVPGGAPDVLAYVVNAKAGTQRPAILHTHGGDFILGSAKESIGDVQACAAELDCVVVTVEYRLAPETRYSGSIEDNYAALKWLYNSAAELGVDHSRIAVMGESAGGGHAALLALRARDRGEVPVLFQMLVYPMLDDRTGSTRAVAKNDVYCEALYGSKDGRPKKSIRRRALIRHLAHGHTSGVSHPLALTFHMTRSEPDQGVAGLTTLPPFITKSTCCNWSISATGSPRVAMMSA